MKHTIKCFPIIKLISMCLFHIASFFFPSIYGFTSTSVFSNSWIPCLHKMIQYFSFCIYYISCIIMSLKYIIIENVNIYILLKTTYTHTQVFNLLSSICRNVVCILIYIHLLTHTCHLYPAFLFWSLPPPQHGPFIHGPFFLISVVTPFFYSYPKTGVRNHRWRRLCGICLSMVNFIEYIS